MSSASLPSLLILGPAFPHGPARRYFAVFLDWTKAGGSPGNGLGLSLVAAISRHHAIGLTVSETAEVCAPSYGFRRTPPTRADRGAEGLGLQGAKRVRWRASPYQTVGFAKNSRKQGCDDLDSNGNQRVCEVGDAHVTGQHPVRCEKLCRRSRSQTNSCPRHWQHLVLYGQ